MMVTKMQPRSHLQRLTHITSAAVGAAVIGSYDASVSDCVLFTVQLILIFYQQEWCEKNQYLKVRTCKDICATKIIS